MSKSKKNIVDPQELIERFGADTVRLFCLFAAPPERDLEWNDNGVEGSYRFLNRVWRLAYKYKDSMKNVQSFDGGLNELEGKFKELYKKTHQTIKKVTEDIDIRFHFNTAVSATMELVNTMYGIDSKDKHIEKLRVMKFALESVLLLLSPIVPHICEELWETLGHKSSILTSSWPSYKDDAFVKDELLIVVQVNGKLRNRINVNADADENTIKEIALSDERVKKFIENKPIKKVVVVKRKLVNIVV